MEWTNEASRTLEALWHEGHSTAAIGRHLGCSKNSVISRARRDNLPPRPNPVNKEFPELAPRRAEVMRLRGLGLGRRDIMRIAGITRSQYESAMRARPKVRPVTSTLKPLPSLTASAPAPCVLPLLPPKPIPEVVPMPPAKPPPAPKLSDRTCSYPLNDGVLPDGRKGWTFCDQRAVFGKSYCAKHQRICTHVVRDRREDAAA